MADYADAPRRRYAALKLAGLDDAPAQLAVFADRTTTQGHGLGRRTMPETVEYSTIVAIHTLWLAARAENIGLGWVSILEPELMPAILDVSDACAWSPTSASAIPSARIGSRRSSAPVGSSGATPRRSSSGARRAQSG
ncbi:MAG: nitroreductase family protein [Pseudomonadota bacterium]